MSERPKRITDLRDLGAAFGISPQDQALSETRESDFYTLPVIDKLIECGRQSEKKQQKYERRRRLSNAISSALRMPKEERDAQGIRIVLNGPLDQEGSVIHRVQDDLSSDVIVVYPFGRKKRYVVTTDDVIKDQEGIALEFIEAQSDAVQKETDADHQRRLLFSIKGKDIGISKEKDYVATHRFGQRRAPVEQQVRFRNVSDTMARLNREKTVRTWQFLKASLDLEEEHPGLQPLFTLEEDPENSLLVKLTMWHTRENTVLERALDSAVPAKIVDTHTRYETNINRQRLEEYYQAYLLSPDTAPPHIRAGYETYILLQDQQLWERQRGERTKTEIFKKVVPKSDRITEILPELSSFALLPLEQQLERVNVPGQQRLRGLERARASREKNLAVRTVLESSPEERAAQGIELFVVAPLTDEGKLLIEDVDHSQYQVFVLLPNGGERKVIHAGRNNLANPLVAKSAVTREELISVDKKIAKEHIMGEDITDRYKRRLQELTSVIAAREHLFFSRDPIEEVELTELQEKEMILLLSCLEIADVLGQQDFRDEIFSCRVNKETNSVEWQFHNLWHSGQEAYLSGEREARSYRFTRNPNQLRVTYSLDTLTESKEAFERGEETEATGAAAIILEKLAHLGVLDE